MSDVEQLVKNEPWRRGYGQPVNALDPTWSIERSGLCGGDIKYHDEGWWSCEVCGCCGNHKHPSLHRPINDPHVYLIASIAEYIEKRASEGVNRELAMKQMLHIAGVAIRYAGSKKSKDLGDYIQQLIVR